MLLQYSICVCTVHYVYRTINVFIVYSFHIITLLVHLHMLTIFTELLLHSPVSEIYRSEQETSKKKTRSRNLDRKTRNKKYQKKETKTENVPRITFKFEVSTINVKGNAWKDFQILFLNFKFFCVLISLKRRVRAADGRIARPKATSPGKCMIEIFSKVNLRSIKGEMERVKELLPSEHKIHLRKSMPPG
jgi:hypothetical protein